MNRAPTQTANLIPPLPEEKEAWAYKGSFYSCKEFSRFAVPRAAVLRHPCTLRAREESVMVDGLASELPRMYTDLAEWFHLLTAPEEYVDEARGLSEAIR